MKAIALFSLFIFSYFAMSADAPQFLLQINDSGVTAKSLSSQTAQETEIRNLKNEIYQLKQAVYELQVKVYNLRTQPYYTHPVTPVPPAHPAQQAMIEVEETETTWSCYLRDPFGNVYDATANIQTVAKAHALKKCGSGVHCLPKKISCTSETQTTKKRYPSGTAPSTIKSKKRNWACMIQDNFKNTHLGEGSTKASAEAKALQACGSKVFCPKSRLECEHD